MVGRDVRARELEHHETIYSGFAQSHFAKPAVRAFRRCLAGRILRATGASPSSRVLSLGCGIGDTELLLAPGVGSITGIDLAPSAIRQAKADAARRRVGNVEFLEGELGTLRFAPASFDVIIAVFLLHHLPDEDLQQLATRVASLLAPGGVFYSLDPSHYRLLGVIGKLVVPNLMKKHRSPDERELSPPAVRELFNGNGLAARVSMYDFFSTPLAGLLPAVALAYQVSRLVDDLVVRAPLLNRLGSNFELVASKQGG